MGRDAGPGLNMVHVAAYSELASTYDRALGVVSFMRTKRAFEHLADRYGLGFGSAADVGCGTGLFACYLRRCWGVPVYAVDRSRAMLQVAAGRCGDPGVVFLNQDVRCLSLPRPVDLVTANFDTVNHLVTVPDLARGFRRIAANLTVGGHFVFDVITRHQGLQGSGTYVRRLRASGRGLFQRIRWHPWRGLLSITIVHCWPRPRPPSVETHVERAYSPAQVGRLLMDAGFVIRGVHDAWSMRVPSACPARLVVIARKVRCRDRLTGT